MDFTGKTVLVTGASRGIGKAVALYFFEKGANVVFAVRNTQKVDLPERISSSNRSYLYQIDMTNTAAIEPMVREIIIRFGRIDILVNNAGVDQPKPLVDITEEHLEYVWDINVKSVIMCTKYVAREMIKQKYGKIINLGSIAGKEGTLFHTAYVSSKHAILGFTKCIAQELIPYNINVNAVCPGLINTDMLQNFFKEYAALTNTDAQKELEDMIKKTPRGEMGEPQDVAELIGFLASDNAKNIVGHAINTDGGILQH